MTAPNPSEAAAIFEAITGSRLAAMEARAMHAEKELALVRMDTVSVLRGRLTVAESRATLAEKERDEAQANLEARGSGWPEAFKLAAIAAEARSTNATLLARVGELERGLEQAATELSEAANIIAGSTMLIATANLFVVASHKARALLQPKPEGEGS